MSNDHETWLKEQGVRVVGKQPLRRYVLDRMPVNYTASEMLAVMNTIDDCVYHIEVPTAIVNKWASTEKRWMHLLETAERNNTHPAHLYIKNIERHRELLAENPMYREAWMEFQSIRALLGEDTHWP